MRSAVPLPSSEPADLQGAVQHQVVFVEQGVVEQPVVDQPVVGQPVVKQRVAWP